MLLPIIRGENGNGLCRIPDQPHEHEGGHHELRLGQILIEEWTGLRLADAVEVGHVNQLVVEAEAAVGHDEFGMG